ncbi:MAG: response regulator [Bacteroidaceae bacterium]|nr:response regulator [Bacteroidaceae bacterium]
MKTSNCHGVDIDSRGFVWISGAGSLGLFDGTHFQYLPTTTAEGRPLFQTAFRVKEAEDDHYWLCSSHGLFLLNARTMQFQHIFLNEKEDSIYGYASNNIIDYPKQNYKLVTTDGYGTFVFDAKSLQVDKKLSEQLNTEVGDLFASKPLIDKHNNLWLATQTGPLACVDLKTMKAKILNYSPLAAAGIHGYTVTSLLETDEGLMIGTNHGLFKYNLKQNLVDKIDFPNNNLCIKSIIRTHDNRILVGTDGRGIWEYDIENGAPTLKDIYAQMAGFAISYGKVMDMKEDQKGNVIAALLQKGIVVIPPQSDCFHYHPISPVANGQNATCVTSITIDADKNYWVGTDGCGVFTTNGMKLATAHPVNDGLNSMLIQDIKIDKHGTVWASSFGGGVQYLENGRWTDRGLSLLNQELAMTMCYDEKTDQLLVGTNGHGIFCIDAAKKTVEPLHIPFAYNRWINSLLLDSNQTLWIGSSNSLIYYNSQTGKHGEITASGDKICNACAIQQDGDDILIASDEGLIIYNIKTQEQKQITKEQGLSCPSVCSIITTPEHIWLATRLNIASIDKKTNEVKNFSSFSGYQIGEFHRNSAVKPGFGYILFGGDNGIICFTPKLISNRPSEIKHVYFTNFKTALNTEELDANILYAKNIYLKNDNATFTIEFSSVELGDPERIHYEYILEGLESQWHTDAPTPYACYSDLSAGTYTFRVRAYLEDNPTDYIENSIQIHVASPWYATIWAILVYTLIALVIAYFIYQQVKARKKQKEFMRETAERDRMKEAKLNLFTSITHELRSPLTMIESPLKQLMAEDQNADHQSLYKVMQRNCDRLLGIVKQITDIRKIDSGQLTLKLEEQDYVEYSERVFEQFKGVATVKEIDFVVEHAEEELLMMIDVTHFEKIITNLLSNAFKFTPQGGKVVVKSGIVGGKVELRFYNSGSHFNEEDLSHLWERFYQGSASSEASGSGIGLNLVYELVKMHHGSIDAKNMAPDGVEFILHFPYFNTQTTAEKDAHTTLLLVDDDAEMIEYIGNQLQKDYSIITAFSGNSAWKQVLTQRPDVVVTDYHMPDGNGMELCQHIKDNPETNNTPVIMLTGEGDEMLQLRSLNLQVDHYLEKPVNMMLLRSAIKQVLIVRENLRSKVNRSEMGSEMSNMTIESAEEKMFTRVNEVIKSHLDNSEFSVQQLSEEVGISRVHLNRKMKERYGVSPNIFIKSFRLKQAAYLLAYHKVNVSEVAYKVGFSSHSYFTTSFHEYFGMSPKEFVVYYSAEENQEALKKLLD